MDQALTVSRVFKVSILLPVHNAANFLAIAIKSILDQTFTDFELLIIDDCSTDNSFGEIMKFNDRRIKLFNNRHNKGIVFCLNYLLDKASGEYAVRMDADDFAYPDRIQQQVEFMDRNPHIDISGSWFKIMGTNFIVKHPVSHEDCLKKLFTSTCFGHPTVIIRLQSFRNKKLSYPTDAKYAEDYSLWVDAAISGLKFGNIPYPLLEYRVHDSQTSTLYTTIQKENTSYVQNKIINSCLGYLTPKEKKLLIQAISFDIRNIFQIIEILLLKKKIIKNKFYRISFTKEYLNDSFFDYGLSTLLEMYLKSKIISVKRRFLGT